MSALLYLAVHRKHIADDLITLLALWLQGRDIFGLFAGKMAVLKRQLQAGPRSRRRNR